MFYPKLTEQRQQTLTTEAFLGYDHDLKLSDGEFYDMENLTSDCYPLLAPRVRRGTVQALSGMQAICARDRLCWVQNQVLHINGASMEAYMPSVNIKAGEKQLVSMGAYLCIFPDGIYFNTEDYSDNGYMGHENTVDAAETPISVSLCLADGQALTLSFSQAAQPESPSNGQYWLDTSGSLHTIKQWAEASGQWVSVPTVYVKLAANGIGKGFKQYDGIEISGLSGNEQLKKLNGSQILYGADESSIVIVGLIDQAAEVTSGTVKTARRVPDMDFITECGNRLWGCKYGVADGKTVNELYCCKLGDFKNWACYQGVATDSWRASCGTDGKWTGAATLAGSPVFFKEDCFHRVYPSASGAHQVVVQKCAGVQNGSSKSLVVVNDRLYYKSRMGVCVYDGSLPQEIGGCFGTVLYANAAAGGVRGKYFISMEDAAHSWSLFVYDTRKGLWHREDSTHASEFARVGDELYFLENGTLRTVYGTAGTKDGPVGWMAETGIMTYGLVGKKYVSRINLRMQLPKGSSVDFWVQYDSDGVWRHCGHIEGRGLRTFLLPVRPARCDHLKFRLTGKGEMKLFSLARVLEAGSDA